MKTYLDCFPCILKQALQAARMATDDSSKQKNILSKVMKLLIDTPHDITPPELSQKVHRLIREITGNTDPYFNIKRQNNEQALKLIHRLRNIIKDAKDPLETAIRLSIAGNLIDAGLGSTHFDIENEVETAIATKFDIFHFTQFKQDILNARTILYLGDNAGEIVFDRLLIEVLRTFTLADIVYVVRGYPILNDATMEDALFVGLNDLVRVVSNGSDAPGTILSQLSSEVASLFEKSDVIISKGQGNYETLNEATQNLYFLLRIKCPIIAKDISSNVGGYILANSQHLS